jgi:hypothetical protein
LTSAGIDPALFADPDNLITYAARDRLFGNAFQEPAASISDCWSASA